MFDFWSAMIGAAGSTPVVALVTYFGKRYFERKGYREAQERDRENIENAARLIEVHQKAVAANINLAIPMETLAFVDPDAEDDEDDEAYYDATFGLANAVLVNKVFESITLERIAIQHADCNEYLEAAQEQFIYAYKELHPALHFQHSQAIAQLIHSYHAALTSGGNKMDVAALEQAWDNVKNELEPEPESPQAEPPGLEVEYQKRVIETGQKDEGETTH